MKGWVCNWPIRRALQGKAGVAGSSDREQRTIGVGDCGFLI
ncbi:hypothetical protein Ga0080559_TMP2862 [Salipiger profundus]|uniref:Uncharacterized protein n=1 Tax=Salipiger profundus TaxID=1229727 RepID=A0A1U7D6C5_9RHOB|nr:hypothetical protein Ga0080559_TMP2862 [Salipiger profundus]